MKCPLLGRRCQAVPRPPQSTCPRPGCEQKLRGALCIAGQRLSPPGLVGPGQAGPQSPQASGLQAVAVGTAPAQGSPGNNSCCPLALALWSICRAQHRSSGPPQCPLTHESFADEEKRVQDLNWGPAPGPHAARLRGAGLASRPGPFSMLTSPPGLGCTEACPCTWANARRPVPAHFC